MKNKQKIDCKKKKEIIDNNSLYYLQTIKNFINHIARTPPLQQPTSLTIVSSD